MRELVFVVFCLSIWSSQVFAKNYSSIDHQFQLKLIAQTDDVIWGFDFLDSQNIIFTERGGKLKRVSLSSKEISQISQVPAVYAQSQGGLLDVRRHPTETSKIYLTYSKPLSDGKSATAVYMAKLSGNKLLDGKDIFVANNAETSSIHYGSRITFDGQGHLFIGTGDRRHREKAQSLKVHNGKILRMNLNGSSPEIWSYGHRNPQGLVYDLPSKTLWEIEFGPRGGDELNKILRGKNYGWPDVTYGVEYHGPKIGVPQKEGTVQPIAWWVPSISPSGFDIYHGSKFQKWKGNFFVGCLSATHLRRLVLKEGKVIQQEELLKDIDERIRNVRSGPDGNIYFSTDSGKLYRMEPTEK